MKSIIVICCIMAISLLSCTTAKESTDYRVFGSINRPTIDIQVDLKLDRSNIIELGKIDETIEYTQDTNTKSSSNDSSSLISKIAYISNLINKDDGMVYLRDNNPRLFDEALGELAGECLLKYPDMDYILFPKIYIEIGSENSLSNSISRYKMRLMGTAVQIKYN